MLYSFVCIIDLTGIAGGSELFHQFTELRSRFDPQAFRRSLEKVRSLRPKTIYFSHFGIKTGLTDHYIDLCLRNLDMYCQVTDDVCTRGASTWQEIAEPVKFQVIKTLVDLGWPKGKALPAYIASNIELNAKGLLTWWHGKSTRQ